MAVGGRWYPPFQTIEEDLQSLFTCASLARWNAGTVQIIWDMDFLIFREKEDRPSWHHKNVSLLHAWIKNRQSVQLTWWHILKWSRLKQATLIVIDWSIAYVVLVDCMSEPQPPPPLVGGGRSFWLFGSLIVIKGWWGIPKSDQLRTTGLEEV